MICKHLLPFCEYTFIFFMMSLETQMFYILLSSSLFFFDCLCFRYPILEAMINLRPWIFALIYSKFNTFNITFRYLICFNYFCIYQEVKIHFHLNCSVSVWRTLIYLLCKSDSGNILIFVYFVFFNFFCSVLKTRPAGYTILVWEIFLSALSMCLPIASGLHYLWWEISC